MKAVFTQRKCLKSVLTYGDIPKPIPDADEVLIEVAHASVNPIDWKLFKGLQFYPFKQIVQGKDVAGTVASVGQNVSKFKVGDHVYSYLSYTLGGGFAEYALSDENTVSLKPNNMSFAEAAGVPLAATTAWQALEMGNIKANDNVLIIGASGGVGTYAVQMAKSLGAKVTAVCSGRNTALATSLGADKVINYEVDDFRESADSFNIIFDAVGKHSLSACSDILVPEGCYITTMPNKKSFFEIQKTKSKGACNEQNQKAYLIGANASDECLEKFSELSETGKLKTVVDRHFQLSELEAAYAYSRTGRARGKIIIDMKNE